MFTLYIGNRNYSSWSLRPWLLMRQAGIGFDEQLVRFSDPQFAQRLTALGAPPRVPVLVDDDFVVWDSLAIVEYLAERCPRAGIWPAAAHSRARARSICAEMHAGFAALRAGLSMNIEARLPGRGHTPEVARDVDRIIAMWTELRAAHAHAGPFLFGAFCAADAYYAPVVSRFATYAVAVPDPVREYMDTILALPPMREWSQAARAEHEFLADHEAYRTARD